MLESDFGSKLTPDSVIESSIFANAVVFGFLEAICDFCMTATGFG